MDFRERVRFGKTGLLVSRIGLASGYGVPAAAIEKAVREYGVNYLYISPLLNLGSMVQAIHNLAPDRRNELCIVVARPFFRTFRLDRFVERWLTKLRLEWTNLLFQGLRKPPSQQLRERIQRLKDRGKVRFAGISSHKRSLFAEIAREKVDAEMDFFHIRYNAVHTGAEQDVFPQLPQEDRPGIVVYTATCWRKLLKPRLMPAEEPPLAPVDCYRFVLSHPDVNVCVTAPSTAMQMEDNLKAMSTGPLNEEEMARVRRIGKHIYGGSRV